MVSIFLMTPAEVGKVIARRAREKRLSLDLSQKTLADRSGVSFGVIKKFERTGKISLESLLKLALVLGVLEEFNGLFKPKSIEQYKSMDELLNDKPRKRGRK